MNMMHSSACTCGAPFFYHRLVPNRVGGGVEWGFYQRIYLSLSVEKIMYVLIWDICRCHTWAGFIRCFEKIERGYFYMFFGR